MFCMDYNGSEPWQENHVICWRVCGDWNTNMESWLVIFHASTIDICMKWWYLDIYENEARGTLSNKTLWLYK